MRRRRFVSGTLGALSGIALGPAAARAAASAPRAGGWQAVPAPGSTPAAQLRRIAAAGPGLAWAVGEEGQGTSSPARALAMVWNGSAWARTDLSHLAYAGRLSDVAGVCADAAWSVGAPTGSASPLLRWDRTTWREAAFPGKGEPDVRLSAVAVGPDRRVWISGTRGGSARLLLGDGQRWRWLDPLPAAGVNLYRVVVRAPDEVWVCGDRAAGGGWAGFVARWTGSWTVLPPLAGLRQTIADVHAVAADDVWAVGNEFGVGGPPGRPGNPILRHWDGSAWNPVEAGFTLGSLSSIAGDAQGRPAWISAWNYQDQSRSTYLRHDAGTWTVVRGPAGPAPSPYVNDVARVPGTSGFWSAGMTRSSPYPPTEAYTERFDD
ncbi:hypothetical protein C9F11_33775 [Streptomyces sp. YIM 121038]|uniref:hypothetical protein n=1 Tax=Streptomyces sp. YIM 121038 TaxID=2136401 RepID=UPI001162A96C|nr:hypothetical protein [Streptomyces sp. YIM 121038]QCX80339.1 hypothetical protein C9F11_33775 [Streptomyces sp. YIM 121038]